MYILNNNYGTKELYECYYFIDENGMRGQITAVTDERNIVSDFYFTVEAQLHFNSNYTYASSVKYVVGMEALKKKLYEIALDNGVIDYDDLGDEAEILEEWLAIPDVSNLKFELRKAGNLDILRYITDRIVKYHYDFTPISEAVQRIIAEYPQNTFEERAVVLIQQLALIYTDVNLKALARKKQAEEIIVKANKLFADYNKWLKEQEEENE